MKFTDEQLKEALTERGLDRTTQTFDAESKGETPPPLDVESIDALADAIAARDAKPSAEEEHAKWMAERAREHLGLGGEAA